jgi:hypothetical protein
MRYAFRPAALAAALLAATPAAAAFPPQYQRLAELRAVMDHQGVAAAFGGTPIERIEYVRTDLYRVSAGAAASTCGSWTCRRRAAWSARGASRRGRGRGSAPDVRKPGSEQGLSSVSSPDLWEPRQIRRATGRAPQHPIPLQGRC